MCVEKVDGIIYNLSILSPTVKSNMYKMMRRRRRRENKTQHLLTRGNDDEKRKEEWEDSLTGNIIIDGFIPSFDIKFLSRGRPWSGVNSRVTLEFIYLSQDLAND